METSPAGDLLTHINDLMQIVSKARKGGFSIANHPAYGPRARASLVAIRRVFLSLQRDFPQERFPRIAFQLSAIEPLVSELMKAYPSDLKGMKGLLNEMGFKVEADLTTELDSPESKPLSASGIDFLPGDILDERHYIPKKILWEINRCYDTACYNSCASMLRRLIEILIISAFEHHGMGDKIKKDGEYVEFSTLIKKASAEPVLKLGRETKRVLPDLKYFGDVGAHSRTILVRRQDLDRLHNQIRGAVEELSRFL